MNSVYKQSTRMPSLSWSTLISILRINGPADSGTKTLRQLHVEDDDEERFQADLKKAVRQSLGVHIYLFFFFQSLTLLK